MDSDVELTAVSKAMPTSKVSLWRGSLVDSDVELTAVSKAMPTSKVSFWRASLVDSDVVHRRSCT